MADPEDLSSYDAPTWSIWLELEDHVEHWREVYREYWGIGANAPPENLESSRWQEAQRYDDAAGNLLRLGLSLNLRDVIDSGEWRADPGGTLELIRSALGSFGDLPVMKDRFSLDLADRSLVRSRGASDRFRRLLELVLAHQLDGRTASYLSRVTELYVFGFEPEALVMCRAALDAALEEKFGNEGAAKSLYGRIDLAHSSGVFSDDQCERAHLLRLAGNRAVHVAPAFLEEGLSDALSAVRILVDLLEAVFQSRDKRR